MMAMMMMMTTLAPPSTVKTAAKALSSWPQRCVEGNQALMHSCTESSVQLMNSSPMYMSSSDSDSHIIAAAGGGGEREGEVVWNAHGSRDEEERVGILTLLRPRCQGVKVPTLLFWKKKSCVQTKCELIP